MSQKHYARIADVYDAFVTTDLDVPFFRAQADEYGGPILELMAGTGRLTVPILEAGHAVTAVDFSPAMLDVLRRKLAARGLPVQVHQADICSFDLGRQFKQIWIPFQALPELTDPDDQRAALGRIHAHLADDGVFICTLHNPPVRIQSVDRQLHLVGNHALPNGGQLLVWLLQLPTQTADVVEVHEFFEEYDPIGVLVSKRTSALRFHLLQQTAFEAMIAEAGFVVDRLYGNYDGSAFEPAVSPFMIWLLRKQH